MAMEDLIHELQIALRKEAGVPSYDPTTVREELPSLQEAVEGLDPSPLYLRCKQCRGSLLRGLQSIVCVYCGAPQQRDIPPDPIPFKFTFGYRWLLQSLDLDGSEAVEASDLNKGQNASKEVLVLSDLFNIELKCPPESDQSATEVANRAPNLMKNPLNFAGVDLDNFFSASKEEGDFSVPEKHLRLDYPVKIAEAHASGQNSLSLFENTQSFETIARPTESAVNDSSSGREAEFQSAGDRTLPLESKAAFNSEAEIMFEFDGIDKHAKGKKLLVSPASMGDSWIQDHQWPTSDTTSSTTITQFGSQTDNSDYLPSTNKNLFQDDLWLTNTEKLKEDEESFDAWQDFSSSGNAPDPFPRSSNLISPIKASTEEPAGQNNLESTSNNFQEMEFDSFMAPDLSTGTTSPHNSSTSANNTQEGSYSDRLLEVSTGDLKSSIQHANGIFDTAQSSSADNTVEMLMSQMHDLSFMLDCNLSIPKKEDEQGKGENETDKQMVFGT